MTKKIISLILAIFLAISNVSFASGENTLVLRTLVSNDFETEEAGSLPKPFGGWKHSTAVKQVDEFDGGKSMHLKTVYSESLSSSPDNVLEIRRSFEGRWIIDFDIYVKEADHLYFAMKEQVTNKVWIQGPTISGGIVNIPSSVKNPDVNIGEFEYNTWHHVTFETDSEARTYSFIIDDKKCIDNATISSGFDFSDVSFRIQAYGKNKGKTTEAYIDKFTAKTYSGIPAINLKGSESMKVNLGESYVEPGFEATDPIDGDLTAAVNVDGEVDTDKEGDYTLCYRVSASDGTEAEPVYRHVTVRKKQLVADAVIEADSSLNGYLIGNIADSNEDTAWKTDLTNPVITFDFESEVIIETLALKAEGITEAKVFTSSGTDGWEKADSEPELLDGLITLSFDATGVKSLKISLEGDDITVYEVYADASNEGVAKYVMELVKASLPSADKKLSDNITLRTDFGFGTNVKWSSSKEDVISNNGNVTLPLEETDVELTATVTYADAELMCTFGPYTVKSRNDGMRVVVSDDMEGIRDDGIPAWVSGSWARNGAYAGVVNRGGNRMLCMKGDFSGSSNPDTVIEYNISNVKDPVVSFDFVVEKPGKVFQALVKDVTNSRNVGLIAVENSDIKVLNKTVAQLEIDKLYSVTLIFDNSLNTVTVLIDGETVAENAQFVSIDSDWDYANIVWRFQIYNHVKGTEVVAYVDNFSITSASYPEITLIGDSEINIPLGEEFEDPGVTAFDSIDGDITERVVASGDVNTNIPGTYTIKYTVSADDGTEAEPVYRKVTVLNNNLLSDAAISSDIPGVENIADGDDHTVWQSENDSEFTVVFENKTIVDKLKIVQNGLGINEISLSYSEDGKKWKVIESDVDYGGSVINAEFEALAVKAVKCEVKGNNFAIADAELTASSMNVVKFDIADLEISDSTSGKDIILPKKGIYGSRITWESSNTSIISNSGSVRPADKTKTVVMTATVTYLDSKLKEEFEVTVKGDSGKGSSGGGAGGSSSGSTVMATVGGKLTDRPADIAPAVKNTLFDDVTSSHWAYSYVESLANEGIVSGTSYRIFEPDRYVTRAEFLKMLTIALATEAKESENPFDDVNESDWYYAYVMNAYSNKIVNGISEKIFAPGSGITRQDMAVMTARALEVCNIMIDETAEASFADGSLISEYAVQSVNALYNLGIINGDTSGCFNPANSLTRAESAKVISIIHTLASN